MEAAFDRFASCVSVWLAKPVAFLLAFLLVLVWLAGGPYFEWSDSYNLVINSVTTIITFLMAFLILSSSARSEAAYQVKLDELIRVTAARNSLIGVEERTAAEIAAEAAVLRVQGEKSSS